MLTNSGKVPVYNVIFRTRTFNLQLIFDFRGPDWAQTIGDSFLNNGYLIVIGHYQFKKELLDQNQNTSISFVKSCCSNLQRFLKQPWAIKLIVSSRDCSYFYYLTVSFVCSCLPSLIVLPVQRSMEIKPCPSDYMQSGNMQSRFSMYFCFLNGSSTNRLKTDQPICIQYDQGIGSNRRPLVI